MLKRELPFQAERTDEDCSSSSRNYILLQLRLISVSSVYLCAAGSHTLHFHVSLYWSAFKWLWNRSRCLHTCPFCIIEYVIIYYNCNEKIHCLKINLRRLETYFGLYHSPQFIEEFAFEDSAPSRSYPNIVHFYKTKRSTRAPCESTQIMNH